MYIRVLNHQGDQIALAPQIKSALDSLAIEAEKPGADWNEVSAKMLRVLEGDGFEIDKLEPEIKYYYTKKFKRIWSIMIRYTGK